MSKDEVVLGIEQRSYRYKYDRSLLRLGSIVHVGKDNVSGEMKFSSASFLNSKAYSVRWIAPSDWYVLLVDRFYVSSGDEARWRDIVYPYLDKASVKLALKNAVAERK